MTRPIHMRVGIAILVKTPGHSPLKTRLAADIGPDAAQQFHMLAAHAVAAVARQAQRKLNHCVIAAAHGLDIHQHVLGPSEDGGFWLFATHGGVPPPAWAATPWSQAETAARFCNALGAASIGCLRRLRDVDLANDLVPLLRDLDALDEPLPEQRRLTEWLRATLR
jgi:glycosyltransferase A (GT-A) superfamily protein (DUF2064 family)